MSAEPTPPPPTQQPQTTRLPFPIEFAQRFENFASTTLRNIPELAGIAIVPVWAIAPEKAKAGMLSLRNPQMPYSADLLASIKATNAFIVDLYSLLASNMQQMGRDAQSLESMIQAKMAALNDDPPTDTDTPLSAPTHD